MLRILCVLAFCLALQSLLAAGEPQPNLAPAKSQAPAWSPTRATPVSATIAAEVRSKPRGDLHGRKKIEALLQTAANLDYPERETVTVQELLDDLHRQHHISIRFDRPTLAVLFSGDSSELIGVQVQPPAPMSDPASIPAVQPTPYAAPAQQTAYKPTVEVAAPAPASTAVKEPATKDAGPPVAEQPAPQPAEAPIATKPNAGSPDTLNPILLSEIEGEVADEFDADVLAELLTAEVTIKNLDLETLSIATVLRHALDAIPAAEAMSEEGSGMPIKMTDAATIDYLVEDDGLLITTRLNALTIKETRVYSLKKLHNVTPDQLAKVVRQSVRPWSWRSQINDLGDQLKSGLPQQLPSEITSLMSSGLQLVAGVSGIPVTYSACPDCEGQPVTLPANAIPNQVAGAPAPASAYAPATAPPPTVASPTLPIPGVISVGPVQPETPPPHAVTANATLQPDAAATTMALSTLVNALEVVAHATLSSLEMMHFAEPPTGTIQTLPDRLVITQSQAAHREIADLMKQLEDE
jgi:hypothetical protein